MRIVMGKHAQNVYSALVAVLLPQRTLLIASRGGTGATYPTRPLVALGNVNSDLQFDMERGEKLIA